MSIRSYFNLNGGLPDLEASLSTCLPMQVIALANKAVEKAIMDKSYDKERCQHFIFIVASVAASSFVLFHAPLKS